jgi:UDP:flavonoid glycosyltransferase YjiC (YdhE family)
LPKTDVYVTNGGYGGVQYALRYGVPIVAAGGHEDKPEVIARVAWTGVGRRIRTETPTPAAVRAVLDDHRYRDAARRIAERMATTRGVHRLAEIVDELIADCRRTNRMRPPRQ